MFHDLQQASRTLVSLQSLVESQITQFSLLIGNLRLYPVDFKVEFS